MSCAASPSCWLGSRRLRWRKCSYENCVNYKCCNKLLAGFLGIYIVKLFQASRSKREKTVAPALRLAQTEALETIETAKSVLRFEEGTKWSRVWAQAGFLTSTQTPSTWAERETLMVTMAGFLDELPQYKNAAKNFTAVIVRKRAAALTQALLDLDVHDTQHTGLAEARETAKKELTFRIRSFIKELNRKLSADDSRWKTYRLESPATERALRPDRKEREETKAGKKAAQRAKTAEEKAAKVRERMEKLKLQLAKMEEAAKPSASANGTGTITSIAA